jgi:fermentation-respiration switch protein FrsA (DUF1100 family)
MGQTSKLLFAGTGIVLGGMLVGGISVCFTTGHLLRVALDRDLPPAALKKRERFSGIRDLDRMMDQRESLAKRLESLPLEDVEIVGHDGVRLVGHLYRSPRARRIVLAMHGWRSSWAMDFGAIADFWFNEGCSVLFAEQRGQNNSGGQYMGFGVLERYDCVDWLRWIYKNLSSALPVYLGGLSMGASTVLMASGFSLPENVRGIIADCGFTSPYDIWKHVAEKNLHFPFALQGPLADVLCKRRIHQGAKDCSSLDSLRNNRVPVLFIHGSDDHFVPVEMTYANYKACAAPKRLFIVPGADHGMSYCIDPEGYRSHVLDFWNTYDHA